MSLTTRGERHKIILDYLKDASTGCIVEDKGKPSIKDDKGKVLFYLEKRIGSTSGNGETFAVDGADKSRKFAVKVTPYGNVGSIAEMVDGVEEGFKEITALADCTLASLNNLSPNLPVMFKALKCNSVCQLPMCPEVTKQGTYIAIINEIAFCDLRHLFSIPLNELTKMSPTITALTQLKFYESMILQAHLSLYALRMLNYAHGDAHIENILVHRTTPGGFWHYKIEKPKKTAKDKTDYHDIYVPNYGFYAVVWDLSFATQYKNSNEKYKATLDDPTDMFSDHARFYPWIDFINVNASIKRIEHDGTNKTVDYMASYGDNKNVILNVANYLINESNKQILAPFFKKNGGLLKTYNNVYEMSKTVMDILINSMKTKHVEYHNKFDATAQKVRDRMFMPSFSTILFRNPDEESDIKIIGSYTLTRESFQKQA